MKLWLSTLNLLLFYKKMLTHLLIACQWQSSQKAFTLFLLKDLDITIGSDHEQWRVRNIFWEYKWFYALQNLLACWELQTDFSNKINGNKRGAGKNSFDSGCIFFCWAVRKVLIWRRSIWSNFACHPDKPLEMRKGSSQKQIWVILPAVSCFFKASQLVRTSFSSSSWQQKDNVCPCRDLLNSLNVYSNAFVKVFMWD